MRKPLFLSSVKIASRRAGALQQERKVMGGKTDAPAGEHPDELDVIGVPVEIDRGEKANPDYEDAEVDEKSAYGMILASRSQPLIVGVPNPHQYNYCRAPSCRLRM